MNRIPLRRFSCFAIASPGLKLWRLTVAASVFLLFAVFPISAEQLPIKIFTTTDGLAQNTINRIVRDSRGFLWFCTGDGLSRYDGHSFVTLGVAHGLPHRRVYDLLETRSGEYWIATGGGLCLFNPKGEPTAYPTAFLPRFTVFQPGIEERSKAVTRLWQGRAGTVWCGTQRGLFRVDVADKQVRLMPIDVGMPLQFPEVGWIYDLHTDSFGRLWIASSDGGLARLDEPDAERPAFRIYTTADGLSSLRVRCLTEGRSKTAQ